MDTVQQQKSRERVGERQEGKEGHSVKQQQQPPFTASPPSASSSPSHEFSFTISLHPSSTTIQDKAKAQTSTFAIDLSPADDIFFHGHLLPLHLLSHLPVSPRSSTNSLDSFTLPIRELLEDQKPENNGSNCSSSSNSQNIKRSYNSENNMISSNSNRRHQQSNSSETKERNKSKSFSLFGRWRKGCEIGDKEEKEKQKRKLRFDVSHVLKRYVRMVRPLLFFRGRRDNIKFRRQPYSFSGNLSLRGKQELRGRRGEFSAPASMRTSPTNSGLLVATATLPSSTSDSTMEELQAAIQAAIAHCKNSIAVEEKLKCKD
ncbi:BRI1 kinase inhibitor 1 [Vitis riparia]|uniref:BRI1 kinase inhibitor 1 n=1 Tax=Vitis riparia TaxID=96939 RepID=UPI00155A1163|nr:BRI1 kinase inhibitor 1 [Vitis riparia]